MSKCYDMREATPNSLKCPLSFSTLKRYRIQEVELFAIGDDDEFDDDVAVADGKFVL